MQNDKSPEQEREHLKALVEGAKAGDDSDFAHLLQHLENFINNTARQFQYNQGGHTVDDLRSVAQIGLWISLGKCDTKNTGWLAYITIYARSHVRNYVRNHPHLIKVRRWDYSRKIGEDSALPPVYSMSDTPPIVIGSRDKDDWGDMYIDPSWGPEELAELNDAVSTFSDIECKVYNLVYGQGKSQRDAARIVGCSQMHISRINKRVRAKVGDYYGQAYH